MSDEEGVEIQCCNKDCTLLCVSAYATEAEAIAAWNTRVDPLRDRLVEALSKLLKAAQSFDCTSACTPENCLYTEARAVLAEADKEKAYGLDTARGSAV
jgi:hypothetical protein